MKILLLVTFKRKYSPVLFGGNLQSTSSFPLCCKTFFGGTKCICSAKTKTKQKSIKLMIESSIWMSSLMGYLQAQESTVMLG